MALKVLTVDDSKTIRMIVKKAFRPYDCEMFEGENGVEGLALANKIKPDLIVLDITMPVMNGIEMLGKLKEEVMLKDIPVIMLTAESGKDNVMKIVKMGVKEYMVKPFKGQQLIDRVVNIVKLEEKKEEKAEDDPAKRYFSADGDIQILKMPGKITRQINVQIEGFVRSRIKNRESNGMQKLILDMGKVTETNVGLIKAIITVLGNCQKAKIPVRCVAGSILAKELKDFQETSDLEMQPTVDEAKAAF